MIPREILKQVRRIEISTRGLVNEVLSGEYHSVFKGRGMNFAEVREYQYGDDIRSIDWNVTARTGAPFVKVFEEERELTVMLVVDVSASGDFGTQERLKGEVAVEICALLAFSAIKNNDRVGLILFTEEVERYVPPKKGRKHVLRLLSEIIAFEPQRKGTSLDAGIEFLLRVTTRKAVAFLLSDFFDDGPQQALRIAAKRHDLIPIVLGDPLDEALPNMGMVWLEDPETGEAVPVPTHVGGFRRRFASRAAASRARLDGLFRRLRIDAIRLETGEPLHRPLLNYFKLRARRA